MSEILVLEKEQSTILSPSEAAGSLALGDALLFNEDLFADLPGISFEENSEANAAFSSSLENAAFSSSLGATAFSSML